jgi:AMP-polyphosphate phosphotransferase
MTAWKVAPEDWEHHRRYDEWELAYEEMFERTDSEWGPWTIVEATDRRFTQAKIFQTVIGALEERLGLSPEPEPELTLPAEINLESEDIEEVWETVPEEDDLPEVDEAPVASAEAN